MIVKRIYFRDAIYSHNEKEFKKFLKTFELLWYEPARKVHVNDQNEKLLTGIYISADQNKKIFAFYEGYEKPATMIVKTLGSGGNLLIDLNSLCLKIGCTIEDKSEQYLDDVLLRLKNFRDINIPEEVKIEKEKGGDSKTLEEFKLTALDIKVRRLARRYLRRYLINFGESLRRRGISMKVVSHFKKSDVKNSVRWGLEHGWIK